ncbi:MAG TPA: type II toxin-antitoxin system prevent-host-death family antitoxin [Caulobacteraceae bacterium]|jgi:prevent-host-death family protein
MATYSVAEAKNNLPKLINQAMAGEDVRITRRGLPAVRIVADQPRASTLDLDWLERVQVKPKNPDYDGVELVRMMRDGHRY